MSTGLLKVTFVAFLMCVSICVVRISPARERDPFESMWVFDEVDAFRRTYVIHYLVSFIWIRCLFINNRLFVSYVRRTLYAVYHFSLSHSFSFNESMDNQWIRILFRMLLTNSNEMIYNFIFIFCSQCVGKCVAVARCCLFHYSQQNENNWKIHRLTDNISII